MATFKAQIFGVRNDPSTNIATKLALLQSHCFENCLCSCDLDTSGQSYKHFTIIIYYPRVIIWGVFKSGTTLES